MPLTPPGRISALIVGNRKVRRIFGFDLPDRDVRWAGVTKGMYLLEIGAGSGLYTEALVNAVGPEGSVVAIEYRKEAALLLSHKIPSARVVVADARRLPLSTQPRFDAVCCFYSIEEITDHTTVLREAARLIKEEGFFVLHLWRPLCPKAKRERIVGVLDKEGLSVEAAWADLQNVRLVLRKRRLAD